MSVVAVIKAQSRINGSVSVWFHPSVTATFHRRRPNSTVEFYLYPTVGTVLIHSAKPELTE